MPNAGIANLSICLLDESDALSPDALSLSSETSFSPAKHTVCGECIRGERGNECVLSNGSEGVGR